MSWVRSLSKRIPNPYNLDPKPHVTRALVHLVSILVAAVLAVGSLILMDAVDETSQRRIIGLWVMLPPLWFLLETAYLNPAEAKGLEADVRKERFEKFKYRQELGRSFWIAVGLALSIMYLKK